MTASDTSAANPTIELVDSSAIMDRPHALLERVADDGYLFFRGLLNPDKVLDVRARLMNVLADQGWLRKDADPMLGLVNKSTIEDVSPEDRSYNGSGIPKETYQAIYKVPQFHAIGHDPALLNLYDAVLGGDVMRHPNSTVRAMLPSSSFQPTPAHQDYIHVQGTTNFWTAWFPLGDCPFEIGGLAVLVGSHSDGLLTYHAAEGAGSLEAYICNSGLSWATTDFRSGDVLTFPSLTVHRGLPNQTGERVRLSLDMRYQRTDEVITRNRLTPHCDMSWEEVYKGSADHKDLMYYWKDRDLQLIDRDSELATARHKIC